MASAQDQQQQQQQQQSLSRLAPSVYSHPSVTDPLLKSPPLSSFYQDPSVLMPRKGFSVSSSGAFFDTSAMAATGGTNITTTTSSGSSNDLQMQNDIIAQLTREMRLNGGGGHMSGGSDVESSTGSTSTLNNPAATADKIAALALQARLTSVGSPPTGPSNIPVPVAKVAAKTQQQQQQATSAAGGEAQQRKSPLKQHQQQSSATVFSGGESYGKLALADPPLGRQQQQQQLLQLQQQQQHQLQQHQQRQQQQQQLQQQQQQSSGTFQKQGQMNGQKPPDSLPLLYSTQSDMPGANSGHSYSRPDTTSNTNLSKWPYSHWYLFLLI